MSTTPTSKQLVDMGLKPGANTIVFDVYGKRDVSDCQLSCSDQGMLASCTGYLC